MCFVGALFAFTYFSHRMIAFQQNHRTFVKAPINEIERVCPPATYETIGGSTGAAASQGRQQQRRRDTDHAGNKICMTTLTDTHADFWQRLIRWRDFDETMQISWPNKLNYCLKHGYHLFDESKKSLDTSRPPAWSKITAAKRLLTEEGCDWVFWLDADTVIMNSRKKLDDFLPTNNSTIDFVVTHEKGKSWNAGS